MRLCDHMAILPPKLRRAGAIARRLGWLASLHGEDEGEVSDELHVLLDVLCDAGAAEAEAARMLALNYECAKTAERRRRASDAAAAAALKARAEAARRERGRQIGCGLACQPCRRGGGLV